MNFEKLTTKFQQAFSDAQSLALGNENQVIEPIHVLSAMLSQNDSSVTQILSLAGANLSQLKTNVNNALSQLPKVSGGNEGELHVSNELSRLLNVTDKLAQQRKDQYIPSELFLLALVQDKGSAGEVCENRAWKKQR